MAWGYGLIAFSVIFLNHSIACRYFKNHYLSILELVAWYFINSITVATFSSIFNDIIFNNVLFTFDSFIIFQYWIFALLLIPSGILIITIRSNRIKNTYLIQAKPNKPLINQEIVIHAENPLNDLRIDISELFYVTSINNYIRIYYLKDTEIKNIRMRSTLKRVEDDVKEHPNFVRCHKGYIVNLRSVNKISKDFSGTKLHLNQIQETIPVSRNLIKLTKEKLKEYTR